MSERPTPETDAAIIEADGAWTFALKNKMQSLERERDEAREVARELRDALAQKGKSVGLSLVDHALLAKAKEVLP